MHAWCCAICNEGSNKLSLILSYCLNLQFSRVSNITVQRGYRGHAHALLIDTLDHCITEKVCIELIVSFLIPNRTMHACMCTSLFMLIDNSEVLNYVQLHALMV